MTSRRLISLVGVFLALATVWWFILPPALGGRTTLFVTRGISMEPYIHQGDLAILHKASSYQTGDVIAYNAKSIRAVSLHRVVAVNSDGSYVVKGDNNPEQDLDNPTPADIYGKMDHLFVGKGDLVEVLTSWPVRIIGLLLIVWSLYGAFFGRRRNSSDDNDEVLRPSLFSRPGKWRERLSRNGSGAPAEGQTAFQPPDISNFGADSPISAVTKRGFLSYAVMGVALAALVASVLITGMAFTKPAATSGERKVIYSIGGKFDYTGPSAPGGELIYDGGNVQTGDPIYFNLVNKVDVKFGYTFTSLGSFEGSGTYTTDVVLRGASGWSHTVVASAPQTFDGRSLQTTASLDLDQLRALTNQVQQLTKVGEGGYTVTIEVNISLDGTLSGEEFKETFPVSLSLAADANILKPQQSSVSPSAVAEPGSNNDKPAVLDGLNPSKSSSLDIPAGVANNITFANKEMTVSELRKIGYSGILFSFVLLLIGANIRTRNAEPANEDISEEALAHYANMFVTHSEPTAEERFRVKDESVESEPADMPEPAGEDFK